MPRYFKDFTLAFIVAWTAISILILSMAMKGNFSVSAVEANGVGVYWDSSYGYRVTSISWGTLEPGSVKNVPVYIRNEGDEPMRLILSTTNWNPSKAPQYFHLDWDYSGQQINLGEALRITLTLSVSRYIQGISSFSFDILVTGSENLLADLNGDGVVDISDFIIVGAAFGSKPGDPHWNTLADSNKDGIVDIDDVMLVAIHFGEHI